FAASTDITYSVFPASPTNIFVGREDATRLNDGEELSDFSDFYLFLKQPQFHCSKLVRMGGAMFCTGNGQQHQMDGNKLVCMDHQMELKARKTPLTCLTLSFGINEEVSFDEAMASFNCEVHMFDPFDWKLAHTVPHDYPQAHFHVSALGEEDKYHLYTEKKNYTVGVFTLQKHLFTNGLLYRPINILK
ncbi:unnamed protein product, partial [Meganyctiphanes norvegica]